MTKIVGLTTGNDTIVAPASGVTVCATAATLNPGDSLTGGVGTDVLVLVGSGFFGIDQLTSFTGFENITVDNPTNSLAILFNLGSQPIEVDVTGNAEIDVSSPSNWNSSDIINGDPSHPTTLAFDNPGLFSPPETYDLTSNKFSHVDISASLHIILTINNSDTAGVQSFTGSGDELVTAVSTLDLSHTTVTGFTVTSTNVLGTTFTVGDLGTALQIAGGPGNDTIVAKGFTFTPDEREAIFAAASIEKIIDKTGTYTAPSPSPGFVGLTTGNDTIVAPASGVTVCATAATLNPGDSLTGGVGTDVLVLVGSGFFGIDQLTSFTGFENITVDNPTNSLAILFNLGSQPIEVDVTGNAEIDVSSPSNWNSSDIINGDPSHPTTLAFDNPGLFSPPETYDLTSNKFSHVDISASLHIILTINNSDTAGVQSFTGSGDELVTAVSTLDLSHTTVTGFTVTSTNVLGTTFTVGDLGTALQIAGGPGNDTIVAKGFTFTPDEREAIFAAASIEKIIDKTGTYTAPSPSPGFVGLTTGNDTIVAPASGVTVCATAATLNPGDSLTGGVGTDVLVLVGSGFFGIDQLTSFTGFENITVDNPTNSLAILFNLGSQPIEVDVTGNAEIDVSSPSNWNSSDIINGDPSHPTTLAFDNPGLFSPPETYDLTSNKFSHVDISASLHIILTINNSDTAGVQSFTGSGDELVTAVSTLDLSHTTVTGFTVTSTNVLGTTFTVGDLGTALQIAGGPGNDTIVAKGFTFTPDEREAIFAAASIEKIIDNTGTYYALTITSETISNGKVTLTGATAEANDTISVYSGSTLLGMTATASDGTWKFTIGTASNSVHTYTFEATDVAGNIGYSSNVAILGSSQTDSLVGTSGNDIIIGNGGNDTITGGLGADTLTGGSGHVTFVYNSIADSTPSSHDTITDFNAGRDIINFANIAGINAHNGIATFEGKLTGPGNLTLNAHSVAYIEVNGNTEVLVNTTSTAETVTSANVSAANMEIVLVGIHLGLKSADFHHV